MRLAARVVMDSNPSACPPGEAGKNSGQKRENESSGEDKAKNHPSMHPARMGFPETGKLRCREMK